MNDNTQSDHRHSCVQHLNSLASSPDRRQPAAGFSRRKLMAALAGTTALCMLGSAEGRGANGSAPQDIFVGEGHAQIKYRWQNVRIGGGGFVTGINPHPETRTVYARTDVGGAYRCEANESQWTPITDWVGGPNSSLSGIESIAIDRHHPDRLYVAAGMYTQPWAPDAVMLRSDDRGNSFAGVKVPFRCGGNEAGRFNGERLMVDPHNPDILFFGSRMDGLWKSTDAARTWQRVTAFPIPSGTQGVGIVCVVFNIHAGRRGSSTPEIFAAVSRPYQNLFRSADAGRTWHLVAGGPTGLRPNHAVLGPDGWLYISYGREPGPNTMTDGAVWKYHLATRQWTNITPISPTATHQRFGYGTVAIDNSRPGTVMCATFCRWAGGDIIFRSTDGGDHWRPISPQQGGRWNVQSTPWLHFHRLEPMVTNWIGSLQIDPHNVNRVWYTTGWGIFRCDNILEADDGRTTDWVFDCNGFEETVINDLASPTDGPHLLSAMGDISGFRHDDLRSSPPQGFYPHGCGSNTSISVAACRPEYMVRTFGGQRINAAFSSSGGRSWQFFPSQPHNAQYGRAAVSCNGTAVVWAPSNGAWAPPNQPVYYTHDQGRSWHAGKRIPNGASVCADAVTDKVFHAFDARRGIMLTSTDAGATFTTIMRHLPSEGGQLQAVPGHPGECWLASGAGLYRIRIHERRMVRCDGIDAATHVGFGRAAPGRQYPAVYTVGVCRGVYGFYRSIDIGTSWQRFNDFDHQFFNISCITGDPRIFGRVYIGTSGRGIIYGDPAGMA